MPAKKKVQNKNKPKKAPKKLTPEQKKKLKRAVAVGAILASLAGVGYAKRKYTPQYGVGMGTLRGALAGLRK